ncbi:SDR family NAD(P)-dependent oxidoreductase [Pseudonocardia sp. WMMC193]|uniref:SDR family NAD(P)-dependent oxidoreductase n=1 Tax=Pseudonocardia sp. WMMC193 TaxID=2911965 RepID=UPI001F2CF3EB|nr:SDR family oxidoreductase [Pseudonocardia sp. WMMC193]MCF7549488.1 SDR family oxidoreductase [Pseudonocardia sp. WMMC193]
MSGKLEGKVAVVTGGSSGIGLAIAKEFVEQGAYVFITGRRATELEKAAEEIGRNVTPVQGDVAKLADLDELYDVVRREQGRVDVVVANAAVGGLAPEGAAASPEHYDKVFTVNARGVFFTVQKAVDLLSDGAAIVLVASNAHSLGIPGFGPYSASKAAVRSFARTWAAEFSGRGIRVNTLSPGPIDTPIYDTSGLTREESDEFLNGIISQVPLRRMGRPEEMAAAALFLASSDSGFITGVDLVADGGMTQI